MYTRTIAARLGFRSMVGGFLLLSGCIIPGVNDEQAGDQGAARRLPTIVAPRAVSPQPDAEDVQTAVLQLFWTATPGATAYDVHLGLDTNPPLVATVTGTSLVLRDLPECSTQYWRVVAVREDDAVSSPTWKFTTRCP